MWLMSSTSKKSDKRGFSRITGLAALKGRLGNIILNGDNSCIMLTGPPGSGKRKLANLIAQAWLCEFPSENGACEECTSCHHFEQQNHFDYSELKPEDGKRIIPTDDVRSALKDLIMFPRLGKYKALVIDADSLNEQGQNALLKALEEPLPHNRFVLTVSDPSRLLLTVRSRVVNLRVDRRSDEEIFQILEEELTSRTTGGDSAEEKSTSAIGEDRFGEQELTSRTTGGDSAEEKSTSAIGGDRFGEQELTSRATGDDFAEEKSASAIGGDRFDEQELAVEVRGDDLKESALPPAKDVLSRTEAALSGVGTVLSRKDLSFYARFSDGIPGRALELVQGSWFGELRS
ncbi:MAG TPA: hypothetical protein GXZ59_00040, partial [Clostridiaceae bacterium]|nr:hypothetical protein [Clostridiaceae bacterium]